MTWSSLCPELSRILQNGSLVPPSGSVPVSPGWHTCVQSTGEPATSCSPRRGVQTLTLRLAAAQGRGLPAEQVLPLLRKQEPELCCQYLEYLVVGRGSQMPEHHTELALSLAGAALQLMPAVDDRCVLSPAHRVDGGLLHGLPGGP